MSDSQFWAWTVLACLSVWLLVALTLAPIVGRLLARAAGESEGWRS